MLVAFEQPDDLYPDSRPIWRAEPRATKTVTPIDGREESVTEYPGQITVFRGNGEYHFTLAEAEDLAEAISLAIATVTFRDYGELDSPDSVYWAKAKALIAEEARMQREEPFNDESE